MLIGYVNNLLECRRDLSVFIEGNPRVYQNTSQLANEIVVSTSCGPTLPVRKSGFRIVRLRELYQGDQTRVVSSRYGGRARLH